MHHQEFQTYGGGISPPSHDPNHKGGLLHQPSHQPTHTPRVRVGKIRDVSAITKLAPSTIRAKVRQGSFPAPTKLSYKIAVWNLDAVESWLLSQFERAVTR